MYRESRSRHRLTVELPDSESQLGSPSIANARPGLQVDHSAKTSMIISPRLSKSGTC